ncbi:GDSL-type esterase/lipase family protein [Butyrivibrio sp. AE3004]|uniref:GDSL-type esterase/lipase family protein n=1 Tax=Butyrivibrio sp. AE3004 TaxID=1506994 RepID=UPI000493C226|nr:GDSL-type esterase/lipase family protein [Butyrivibrio sp. AE3004]
MSDKKAEDILADLFQREKRDKLERYRHLNRYVKKGQILFTGSSLMEQFPVNEIAMTYGIDAVIYNRGIGGYTIPEMLDSMDEQIFALEPAKIFINIGTNDISREDETIEMLVADYRKVLLQIKERLPEAEVYMMAYYPVNVIVAENQPWQGAKRAAELRLQRLEEANHAVKELAAEFDYHFIDVNKGLTDENGQTRKELSIDGIHMWSDAYEIIFENMKKYILE